MNVRNDKLLDAAVARQANRGPNDDRTFSSELEARVISDAEKIANLEATNMVLVAQVAK